MAVFAEEAETGKEHPEAAGRAAVDSVTLAACYHGDEGGAGSHAMAAAVAAGQDWTPSLCTRTERKGQH